MVIKASSLRPNLVVLYGLWLGSTIQISGRAYIPAQGLLFGDVFAKRQRKGVDKGGDVKGEK